VAIWQSDALTRALQSVLAAPLTTNLDRANLAGTALAAGSAGGAAPRLQWRLHFRCGLPQVGPEVKVRDLFANELEELELATDEALGRIEPK
jgi:hypothetical protein